jgi:hypothetical protein
MPTIRTLYIYISKDVGIRGHFQTPKGVFQQTSFGHTATEHASTNIVTVRNG